MKQKKLKYILIGGTLLVWGTIIFRVVEGVSQGNPITNTSTPVANKPESVSPEEHYTLIADYPDPFIRDTDTIEIISAPPVTDNTFKPPPNQPPPGPSPEEIAKNSVKYSGMISNPEKKIKLAIVNILGKDALLKVNDKSEGYTIKKIETNLLTVAYKGKIISISKTD